MNLHFIIMGKKFNEGKEFLSGFDIGLQRFKTLKES